MTGSELEYAHRFIMENYVDFTIESLRYEYETYTEDFECLGVYTKGDMDELLEYITSYDTSSFYGLNFFYD